MIWTETNRGLFPSETAHVGPWTLTLWRSWRGCGWSVAAPDRRFIDGIEGTWGAARAAAASTVLARAADGDLSAHERAALTVIAQDHD